MTFVTAVALLVCLVLLQRYIRRGLSATAALRTRQGPLNRRQFFRDKLVEQWKTMIVAPFLALTLSGLLHSAFNPGEAIVPAARLTATLTGASPDDFDLSLLSSMAVTLTIAIVVLEALPILFRWKRRLVLGNFTALLPQSPAELPYALLLAIGAGLGEEMLFRGEIPHALAALGLPLTAGLLVSCVIFAACHVYQGWVGVLAVGFAGLLLTAIYAISGNLWLAIAVHVTIDVIGLVIRPALGMGLKRLLRRS
ncbi:CPBP family intramembrane glutamic endopeptidase [Novosphingobium sp. 9]|uniref:CPBP family intramembrane glutamic endopeptidase n=1 Tax=Novosphingobium sp. 9 TaxID=2025349 RepID=UPI0021B5F295|nr:CPBP family intramembrane glutamic endopeptidase [Novosphingobium sp. 9]